MNTDQTFKLLAFPKVEILEEKINETPETCFICKLDWAPKENHVNRTGDWGDSFLWLYSPIFPQEYKEWLYSLRFELNHHYLEEIRNQCTQGVKEWDRDYLVDIDTHKRLIQPAIDHFNNAFYLLACRLLAPNDYKSIAEIAMKINFWDKQTGKKLVLKFADFDGFLNNKDMEITPFVQNFNTSIFKNVHIFKMFP
jgi:hypothetical protein